MCFPLIRFLTFAAALVSFAGAQAQTLIASGNYAAGEQVYRTGGVSLGPGTYRFSFATTAPLAEFYGQVEKQSYWSAYCDERDGQGEFFCGGDNVPTIPLFDPVTPTLYQLKIKVNPYTEILTPDDYVVRTVEFDDCCTHAFDFVAGEAGSYRISYAAVPEPAAWALCILGFGAIGHSMRRRSTRLCTAKASLSFT